MNKLFQAFLFVLLSQLSFLVLAGISYQQQIQQIIEQAEPPEGVVFEIVSSNKRYLDWALAEAEKLSGQLHEKFPQLDITVVTHGSEQFALTKQNLSNNAPLNEVLKSLVSNEVQVHVCGTHAEWKQVTEEEFTELVDVAAEGPAKINDYIQLGYVRIRLKQ